MYKMGSIFYLRYFLWVACVLFFKCVISYNIIDDYRPCSNWRLGDPDLDYDLIRRYRLEHHRDAHNIEGSSPNQIAYRLSTLSNMTLKSTSIFPYGVPNDFSFECTYRTPYPPTNPWRLFHLADKERKSKMSITMSPADSAIILAFPNIDGNLETVSFQEKTLFDRSWHKIIIGVNQNTIRLWVDCRMITGQKGQTFLSIPSRGTIEYVDGYIYVAEDLGSWSTVPIDLQLMLFSCDPLRALRVTCDESLDLAALESIRIISAPPVQDCQVQCPRGPPGANGLPGLRGFPGPQGLPGPRGPPGYATFSNNNNNKHLTEADVKEICLNVLRDYMICQVVPRGPVSYGESAYMMQQQQSKGPVNG